MAFYRQDVLTAMHKVATFRYVDRNTCKAWNEHRRGDELRLLTGWCWTERKAPHRERQGFKTLSVCQRDAFYTLIRKETAPVPKRLRLVSAA